MFYFDVSSKLPAHSAHPALFAHCEQAEQGFFKLILFLVPRAWNIDRQKQVNVHIVKTPVRADTLIVIDDAKAFLVVFQVVDKGRCRQRLFQIIQAPAFIDLIEIRGLALCTLPNLKIALGFKEAQNVIALLHRFFQIRSSPLTDGELIIVLNQPMQPLQRPKQDAFFFTPHLVDEKRVIHSANRLFLGGEQQLAAIESIGLIIQSV